MNYWAPSDHKGGELALGEEHRAGKAAVIEAGERGGHLQLIFDFVGQDLPIVAAGQLDAGRSQLQQARSATPDERVQLLIAEAEREGMAVQNSPFQEADNLVKMVTMLYAAAPRGKKVKATYVDAIIEAVRWLLQDATYMTGEILRLDGGRTALG